MSQEIIYTSAPAGLKPGSRGFCTVAATRGIAKPLADQLEDLSGYRHLSAGGDGPSAANPIVYSHLKLSIAGRAYHVLSRICDAGLDYSRRTNKLAHHVAVEPADLVPAGPAAILTTPGFMATAWSGEPAVRDFGPRVPQADAAPGVCQAWAQVAGDAGWGGVTAEALAGDARRQIVLVYRAGLDVLRLVAETLALLPPAKRWDATFCTYFTKLPPTVDCRWRCVVDGTPEAVAAARAPGALVIDLRRPLAAPPESPYVEAARTGRPLAPPPTAIPAVSQAATSRKPDADDLLLEALGEESRDARKRRTASPREAKSTSYGLAPPPIAQPYWEAELADKASPYPPRILKRKRTPAFWATLAVVACAILLSTAYGGYLYVQHSEQIDQELLLAAKKAEADKAETERIEAAKAAAESTAEKAKADKAVAEKIAAAEAKAKADQAASEKAELEMKMREATTQAADVPAAIEPPATSAKPKPAKLPPNHIWFAGTLSGESIDIPFPESVREALSTAESVTLQAINIDRQQKGVIKIVEDSANSRGLLVKKDINFNNATIATFQLDDKSLRFIAKADLTDDMRTIASHLIRVSMHVGTQSDSFDIVFWKPQQLMPFEFTHLSSSEVFERPLSVSLSEAIPQLDSVRLDNLPPLLKTETLVNDEFNNQVDIAVWDPGHPSERIMMRIDTARRQSNLVIRCRILPTCFDSNSANLSVRQLITGVETECSWHLIKACRINLRAQLAKDSAFVSKGDENLEKLEAEVMSSQITLNNPRAEKDAKIMASKSLKHASDQKIRLLQELKVANKNIQRISNQLPLVERYERVIDELQYAKLNFRSVVVVPLSSGSRPVVVPVAMTETESNK
jgi:hypothetical protein